MSAALEDVERCGLVAVFADEAEPLLRRLFRFGSVRLLHFARPRRNLGQRRCGLEGHEEQRRENGSNHVGSGI